GIRNIRREYIDLLRNYVPVVTQRAWEAAKNYYKNRYKIKMDEKEDYINASYVSVGDDMMFICTLFPYYVNLMKTVKSNVRNICRMMKIEKNLMSFGCDALKSQEVMYILYTGWPDHFVAESIKTCREVQALILKYCRKRPVVVHCSADLRRTGTYAAFEMAIQKNKKNEMLVIPDVAKSIRDQRMDAIQNDQQYLFIYRMVLEVLIADQLLTKTLQVMNFIQEYDDLVRQKRTENAKFEKFQKCREQYLRRFDN
uniref:Tyrosine-protein phosphatase domain-containing protein n=1 Tax=Elaeophora elaphi TaxID=1147741 RepID=A0A0R3RJ40_9BILA